MEIHHVRKLSKTKRKDYLSTMMARMNRKQIPVCQKCHIKIHQGVYDGKRVTEFVLFNSDMSESRMQGNLHVRFGVDLSISNEIGELGHFCLWEQYFLFSAVYTTGLKK